MTHKTNKKNIITNNQRRSLQQSVISQNRNIFSKCFITDVNYVTCYILLLITEVISTLWHWQINWSSCHKIKRNFDKLLAGNEVQLDIISFSKKRACCTEPMVFWNFKMFVHFLNSNHNFENTYKYNQNKTGKHLKKKLHTSILLHSFFLRASHL